MNQWNNIITPQLPQKHSEQSSQIRESSDKGDQKVSVVRNHLVMLLA